MFRLPWFGEHWLVHHKVTVRNKFCEWSPSSCLKFSWHKMWLTIYGNCRPTHVPSLISGRLSFKLKYSQPLISTTLTKTVPKHVYYSRVVAAGMFSGLSKLPLRTFACPEIIAGWGGAFPCLAVPFTEKQTEICIAQVSTKAKCDHSQVLACVSRVFITWDVLECKMLFVCMTSVVEPNGLYVHPAATQLSKSTSRNR